MNTGGYRWKNLSAKLGFLVRWSEGKSQEGRNSLFRENKTGGGANKGNPIVTALRCFACSNWAQS